MDNLTHSLVGALIGQAGLKQKTGLAMPALIVGANLPDVDVACFLWLEGVEHLAFRRGITHGPIAWLLLPLLLAGGLWWWDRRQARRGTRPEKRLPVRFGWICGLAFLACLTHPALDWLNVYGIRLLEPFSSRWFYGDVLFIIDVWLWGILGVGTWLSLRRERRGGEWERPARTAMALALTYIGMNAALTWHAETSRGEMTEPYPSVAIGSPPPLLSWERERIIQASDGEWLSSRGAGQEFGYGYRLISPSPCTLPNLALLRRTDAQLDAYLFWSRASLVERAPDGSVLVRDARYYDPRARDRFTLAVQRAV